jgi:hypothetical protein
MGKNSTFGVLLSEHNETEKGKTNVGYCKEYY